MSVSSKEFLDIQATIECGFTLKSVSDMIRTYSQCDVNIRSIQDDEVFDMCVGSLIICSKSNCVVTFLIAFHS